MFRTVLAAACVAAASAFAPMTALPRTGARGNTLSYNFSTHTVHFSILSADACFQRSPAGHGQQKGETLARQSAWIFCRFKGKRLVVGTGLQSWGAAFKVQLAPPGAVHCRVTNRDCEAAQRLVDPPGSAVRAAVRAAVL
jgi:hypothetical protein